MKLKLFLTMSFLIFSSSIFAADPSTAQVLQGCDEEFLGTTAGMQSCFKALGDAREEYDGILKAQEGLTTKLGETAETLAQTKELVSKHKTNPLGSSLNIPENLNVNTSDLAAEIQSQIKKMSSNITPKQEEKITARLNRLKLPTELASLNREQLHKFWSDNTDGNVQEILGCRSWSNWTKEDECGVWEEAIETIRDKDDAISQRLVSGLSALQTQSDQDAASIRGLTAQAAALAQFANTEETADDQSGVFFDKLQEIGMLGKLAFLDTKLLGAQYDITGQKLENLKDKIKNSILGNVINEMIDSKIQGLQSEVQEHIGVDQRILKTLVEKLQAKACQRGAAQHADLCGVLGSVNTDLLEKTSPASVDSPVDASKPSDANGN